MKVFFQTLLPKTARTEGPDTRLSGAKAPERGAPGKGGASGKSASPSRAEDDANERPRLTLEAGDFIDRVPHHLLRFGNFDLHRPLQFDLAEIADRITRGSFTIPLSDLLKAIPEMFADDAQALHALEIRFPWQRVMQMVNESAAAEKEAGGETLAEKLRRLRKPIKTAKKAEAPAPQSPLEARRESISQTKRGGGRDADSAWFTKRAITFDGAGAPAAQIPEVPDSAPPLFELPESRTPRAPGDPQPVPANKAPAKAAVPVGLVTSPSPTAPISLVAPAAPAAATTPTAPISLVPPAAPTAPISLVTPTAPTTPTAPISLVTPGAATTPTAPISLVTPSAPAVPTAPISLAAPAIPTAPSPAAAAAPAPPPTRQPVPDIMNLTLVKPAAAPVPAPAPAAAPIPAPTPAPAAAAAPVSPPASIPEPTSIPVSKSIPAPAPVSAPASIPAPAPTPAAAPAAKLVSDADQKMFKAKIAFLEAQLKTQAAKHQEDLATQNAETDSLLKKLRAEKEKERQEMTEDFKAVREHMAEALEQEQQRVVELESRLEFDLFAVRVESAQIVEQERERARGRIAEMEARLAEERAAHERDAQERAEMEALLAQERAALQHATEAATPIPAVAAPAADHSEELARLRAELEEARELAAAQAAAHEQVAAQFEDDVQNYRKRILAVLNEKTALTAKLREAESALQVAIGTTASNAA